jgi:hypothetical protein
MKYTIEDIKIIDPEKSILKNQEMYFGSRRANPESICSGVAEGALILGATKVVIEIYSGFWCIAADIDWLNAENKSEVNENSAFSCMHAFQEWGVNSFRSEYLISIFSRCVIIFGKSLETKLIKGNIPTEELLINLKSKYLNFARVVCFEFDSRV